MLIPRSPLTLLASLACLALCVCHQAAPITAPVNRWLDIKRIPGYPAPDQPHVPVEQYQVTTDGKITRLLDDARIGEITLTHAQQERLHSLASTLNLHEEPRLTVDSSSIQITLYRDGRPSALPPETTIPPPPLP